MTTSWSHSKFCRRELQGLSLGGVGSHQSGNCWSNATGSASSSLSFTSLWSWLTRLLQPAHPSTWQPRCAQPILERPGKQLQAASDLENNFQLIRTLSRRVSVTELQTNTTLFLPASEQSSQCHCSSQGWRSGLKPTYQLTRIFKKLTKYLIYLLLSPEYLYSLQLEKKHCIV